MRTVNEVSKITGVSVRTLHHYDAIGLLKPTKVTEAGYRMYDDTAISRLQSILRCFYSKKRRCTRTIPMTGKILFRTLFCG